MIDKIEYFVGIFGFMQLSMQDVGLLDKQGVPVKKKHMTLNEVDAVYIYKWLSDELRHVNVKELRELAKETDNRVSKLISGHSVVNNFLLSILLLREYLDANAPKNEQLLLLPKVSRVITLVDSAISDEEFNADINRTTARTANNIYRQMVGKAQLSDEIRDLVVAKYFKGK